MRVVGRVILSAVLLILTGLAMAAAAFVPELFFSFYTDLSRQAMDAIAGVTGKLPFALWEWLAVIIVLLTLYDLVKHKKPLSWLAGVVATVCTFVFVFMGLWGLNYFAPSVAERTGLQVQEGYSVQELQETALYMARQAEQAAELVQRGEDGLVAAELDTWLQEADEGYDQLAQTNEFFAGPAAPVKKLASSRLFSHMGFTGIFIPFTAECNVNTQTDPAALPFTICHELAHRLTVAREDEANFCAFLACISHSDPDFQYSGWYSAYLYTYNALYQADRAAALVVKDSISSTLRRDIDATNAHYEQFDSPVQEAAQKANDLYLKTVGDADGAESYGKAADLLVAWYLDRLNQEA